MKKKVFKVQTVSVYISTTLVLLLLGIMGVLFIAAQSLSKNVQQNLLVTVVLSNSLDDNSIANLKKTLEKDSRVHKSNYISREQALAEESEALKTNPAEILGYNPYEASIELTLKPEYSNSKDLADFEKALSIIEEKKDVIKHKEVKATSDVSKVSIVGAGMVTNPGVAAKMFEALFDAQINIHMIATSEIKVSVLIDRGLENLAVKAIQQKFDMA